MPTTTNNNNNVEPTNAATNNNPNRSDSNNNISDDNTNNNIAPAPDNDPINSSGLSETGLFRWFTLCSLALLCTDLIFIIAGVIVLLVAVLLLLAVLWKRSHSKTANTNTDNDVPMQSTNVILASGHEAKAYQPVPGMEVPKTYSSLQEVPKSYGELPKSYGAIPVRQNSEFAETTKFVRLGWRRIV